MSDHDSIRPLKTSKEEKDSGNAVDPLESEGDENRVESAEQEGEGAQELKADEDIGEEEAQPQRVATSPRLPSVREREEHELTHCPFRSWCEHCTKGQKKDFPHKKVTGELAESSVVRVSMDYCFFTEDVDAKDDDHEETVKAKVSLTVLVMVEALCRSVWLESHGSLGK